MSDTHSDSESNQSDPEELFECTNCNDNVKEEDCEVCASCENYVCGACSLRDYPIGDWFSVDAHCSKCGQVRCQDCVYFCYDCANQGDCPDSYCRTCCPADIQGVHCGYHCWYNCQKHRTETGNQCGECHANQNYAARH